MQLTTIPDLMKDLPVDRRGYPVPFVVIVDGNGTPHFKANDYKRYQACIERRLCNICGKALKREFWFLGGQESAFHPHGAFVDGPLHHGCGLFALQNCPYMLYTDYRAKEDEAAIKGKMAGDVATERFHNPTQTDERLLFFVFARAKEFTVNRHPKFQGAETFKPHRPYEEVEYYREGGRIHKAEAKNLLITAGRPCYFPR